VVSTTSTEQSGPLVRLPTATTFMFFPNALHPPAS
jgi:hypothetical protein